MATKLVVPLIGLLAAVMLIPVIGCEDAGQSTQAPPDRPPAMTDDQGAEDMRAPEPSVGEAEEGDDGDEAADESGGADGQAGEDQPDASGESATEAGGEDAPQDGAEGSGDEAADDADDEPAGEIITLTEENFEAEVMQSDIPVLVDFSADWCQPCVMLHPVLAKLAERYAGRVKIGRVDTDRNQALARRYQVRGIPALFLIKDGQVVDSAVGYRPESQLRSMIEGAL